MDTDLTIAKWQVNLEKRIPTSNMMRWMSKYTSPCNFSCCYSPMCASIQCTHCKRSLTSNDTPHTRYLCIECPPETSAPEYCEQCYDDAKVIHDHAGFCQVDSKGNHKAVIRTKGIGERKQLKITDFPVINQTMQQQLNISVTFCPVCCSGFDDTILPVGTPGCQKFHGISKRDKGLGDIDSRMFFCGDCAMSFSISKGNNTYCDINSFCGVCRQEKEMEQREAEFRERAEKSGFSEEVYNDLRTFHVKPWIRALLDICFKKL